MIVNDCKDTASARLLDDEQVAKPEELEESGKFPDMSCAL
jgi:hypothetical protein